MTDEQAKNDRLAEIEDCLGWIVAFMNEHPEWTAEHFTSHGQAGPETEWLERARALVESNND